MGKGCIAAVSPETLGTPKSLLFAWKLMKALNVFAQMLHR